MPIVPRELADGVLDNATAKFHLSALTTAPYRDADQP